MNKIWCRNNLLTVGKWGGGSFLVGVVISAFAFGFTSSAQRNFPLRAYALDTIPISSYQSGTEFKLDLDPISKINNITVPVDNLINSTINSLRLNQGIDIGTGIPLSPIKNPSQNIDFDFSRFFSSSTVSSNDVMSFLKEAAITGINLSILIISITTQILKGILSALR